MWRARFHSDSAPSGSTALEPHPTTSATSRLRCCPDSPTCPPCSSDALDNRMPPSVYGNPMDLAPVIRSDVARALTEDIGSGDVTASLVPKDRVAHARVVIREMAVLCGSAWFDEVFRQIDPETGVKWHAKDGDRVSPDQALCEINGRA